MCRWCEADFQFLRGDGEGLLHWYCRDCEPPELSITASTDPESDDQPPILELSAAVEPTLPHMDELEQSLDDVVPTDSVLEDQPIQYDIVEDGSNKRRRKLVTTDGYAYIVKKATNRTTTWRCSVRNKTVWCKATVLQRGADFIPGSVDHIHAPDHLIVKRVRIAAEAYTSLSSSC
ncbi:uncharacterized protein [Argopecten irradians]|uniref:uncharacterized protein n=1 Tax=Argopecten irradians TaxID=31199 RepID=UPI003715B7D5